jgi:hypothetical protein
VFCFDRSIDILNETTTYSRANKIRSAGRMPLCADGSIQKKVEIPVTCSSRNFVFEVHSNTSDPWPDRPCNIRYSKLWKERHIRDNGTFPHHFENPPLTRGLLSLTNSHLLYCSTYYITSYLPLNALHKLLKQRQICKSSTFWSPMVPLFQKFNVIWYSVTDFKCQYLHMSGTVPYGWFSVRSVL